MYIKGINDNDLCNLIYKAGALLFPQYESLFSGDIEEFQQHCAILILPKLKKYDESKGALSTYIYNFLPLLLGNWYQRKKESKTMLFELNKVYLDGLVSGDDDWGSSREYNCWYVDDIDIPKELMKKDLNKLLDKIKINFPTFTLKETEGLTFRQLGSRLKVGERRAKYLYIKDLIEIRKSYAELLKSLYIFD